MFPGAGIHQKLTYILVVALPDLWVCLFYQAVNKASLKNIRPQEKGGDYVQSDKHKYDPTPPAAAQRKSGTLLFPRGWKKTYK